MRIVVLAALALLLAGVLWIGAEEPDEPRDTPGVAPDTEGPGLGVRAQPLEAKPQTGGGLEVRVRLRGRPASALVGIHVLSPRQLEGHASGLLDLGDLQVHAAAPTNSSGSARFGGLSDGTYLVGARGEDGGHGTLLTDVRTAGGAQVVVVDLLAGVHSFTGRLVEGERVAVGWRVQLRFATDQDQADPYAQEHPIWSTTPDAQGRFAFGQLPHGRYVLGALRPGRASIAFQSILVPTPGEHVFDVGSREFAVEGVVKDSETDAPIAGATIRFDSDSQGWSRCEVLRTDANGRFVARVGNWSDVVRIEARGYGSRTLHGRSLEDAGPLVIHLARVGRVEGRVVAAEGGAPLAGASVCLFRWNRGDAEAHWTDTDAAGRFAFAEVRPGEVGVFVLGGGRCSAAFDVATGKADPTLTRVRPGEATVLTLATRSTVALRGRVLDAGGAPVEGARIVPNPVLEIRGLSVVHRLPTPLTDGDGAFELRDLVPGSHFGAEVWIDGRPQGYAHLYVDRGRSEPIEIRLEALRRYVVEVLDASTGKPVPDAVVRVDDERAAYAGRPWLTDAAGRVLFDLAHDYFGVLSVQANGYQPLMNLSDLLQPAVGGAPSVTFRLERGAEIAGRVHLPAGIPATAVLVSLEVSADDERDGDVQNATVDAHGRFAFQGVPPGTHTLQAESWWRGRGHSATVEASAGARDVELRLEPEADEEVLALRVRVRDARGRPLVRGLAFLFITTRKGLPRRHQAIVHGGEVTFRNARGAPRWLVVTPTHDASGLRPNLMPSLTGPLDLGRREVDVVLRGGRAVRGRVTDAAGRPVAGVELHATVDWRIGAFRKPMPIFVAEAHTDGDGRFVLSGLPPEEVEVQVWQLPLGWVRPRPVHLGADTTTWDLVLEPAARATIRVVDWQGKPVRKALVRWVPQRGGWKQADAFDQRTDNRGHAEFGNLRADEPFALIVVPPDDRKDCLTYRLAPAPLESRTVQLPRGHRLEVTVLDRGGHPVRGATVWRDAGDGWWAQGSTDAKGVQVLGRVPAGEIALRAQRRGGAKGDVVRVPGDAGTCTLRVPD